MPRSQYGKEKPSQRLRATIWVAVVGSLLILSGCTFGNYGALVARYTYTDAAVVVDVYSLGLQVRPHTPDYGATLGYRHASYVLSKDAVDNQAFVSHWRWFNAPWPSGELITRASTSLGIELQATSEISRLALGYVDQAITAGPAADESRVVTLYYNRALPQLTYLSIKVKEGEFNR